ncbi:MAG: hypothetical protein QOC81_3924 [Thermoanaerobaculia bacterium]|jgi:hypothetical protein|nr:hypothetical protein [Thermoanaerobaculia bacterium]
MTRLTRSLLAFALLACASFARGESLRLLAPASGATLRGGSFAELRWSAGQLPASAEEWEAFLSVDGGKYYAFRVTPHLEIDRRSFTFIVPNVDTHDARILIRTGDEVHEAHFETRESFSIVRDSGAEQLMPRVLQFGRGEAAREGDPGVLSWADGARNGSGLTQQSSTPVVPSSLSRLAEDSSDAPPVLAPAGIVLNAPPSEVADKLRPAQGHAREPESLPVTADLLLVCSRWNI